MVHYRCSTVLVRHEWGVLGTASAAFSIIIGHPIKNTQMQAGRHTHMQCHTLCKAPCAPSSHHWARLSVHPTPPLPPISSLRPRAHTHTC